MHQTLAFAPKLHGFRLTAWNQARRLSAGVLLAALLTLVDTSAAFSSDQPSNPFGGTTVTWIPDPLVRTWNTLLEQIKLDDLIVSSCTEDETEDCTAARKLRDVVDEARNYQGRALIGHVNRSINLMIKPSAGSWTSALDILKVGSGDCKDYSIAKYAALRIAGIPPSNIRLVIVHITARKENHMVVSVYDQGQWLLLDNLTMRLVTDTDQTRYTPMYVLDETGVRRYIAWTGA